MIHAECCPADKFRGSCAATQVQRLAFVTRLLAGCPSLESEERILWTHPVNLSVGFRIPRSEQKRFRTPSLARKLLHGGPTKVASPTSQIPGIHKTWGLLSLNFQLKVQTQPQRLTERGSGPGTRSSYVSWIPPKLHHFADPWEPMGLCSVVHTRWRHSMKSQIVPRWMKSSNGLAYVNSSF